MFGKNRGLGGLFSQEAPMSSRQLNLTSLEGFTGNGIATIGVDNTFSVLAHMPPPHAVSPYPAVYAAYLVDSRGKNGFFAGILRPAGNGMYQAYFRSPVPLVHYDKVVVSLENPQTIAQTPQGPIVMKVKEGFLDGLGPVKKIGSNVWGRLKGFVANRTGEESAGMPAQPGTGQPPMAGDLRPEGRYQGYQGNYAQGGYGSQRNYSSAPPQGGGYVPPSSTWQGNEGRQPAGWQGQPYGYGYRQPPQGYRPVRGNYQSPQRDPYQDYSQRSPQVPHQTSGPRQYYHSPSSAPTAPSAPPSEVGSAEEKVTDVPVEQEENNSGTEAQENREN